MSFNRYNKSSVGEMPQLSEKLISIRPDIPIIICSGHSSMLDEEKMKKVGISAVVTKPFIKSELAKTSRGVLDK